MVSNADLHKSITQFRDDFKTKCDSMAQAHDESIKNLADKIDSFGSRLVKIDQRLDKLEEHHLVHAQKSAETEEKLEEIDAKIDEGLTSAVNRIAQLETQLQRLQVELPEEIRQLRIENDRLSEEIESRTNRQLRRTLIFRNIPETKEDETYAEVKELLAQTIGSCTNISKEEAFAGIERAHREAKRERSNREGKRKIFVAFLNWELPQRILDEFRKKNIEDRSFNIYAEQMYGPLTSQRRNLAFQLRKALKDEGTITSGFVAFPARLMVNKAGELDRNGRKIYKQHSNFSSHKVEKKWT